MLTSLDQNYVKNLEQEPSTKMLQNKIDAATGLNYSAVINGKECIWFWARKLISR